MLLRDTPDGGYRGNLEVIMPYRKPRDGSELPEWKQDYNARHRKVRTRIEHALARLKTYATTVAPPGPWPSPHPVSPTCTTSLCPADRKPVASNACTELRDVA